MKNNPIGSSWQDVRKSLFSEAEIQESNLRVERMRSGCAISKKKAGATIFDVAKYILHKRGTMSTMKLQKLCYYAQGWNMVWNHLPLFNEDFQAWTNGPVCKELFASHHGRLYVSKTFFDLRGNTDNLSDFQMDSIDAILEMYAEKDAQSLSNLTHTEDPWIIARGNTPKKDHCDTIITKESMFKYYSSL